MPVLRRLPVWFTDEQVRALRDNHRRFKAQNKRFAHVTFPAFVKAMLQVGHITRHPRRK